MTYATNGAAIINGKIVPASEVLVLRTLVLMNRPATVPEIALEMKEVLSDASLYSLLGRLKEKRALVKREEAMLNVHGRPVRRVQWSAHQAATEFFIREDHHDVSNVCAVEGIEMAG